jgi:hypothetical protein
VAVVSVFTVVVVVAEIRLILMLLAVGMLVGAVVAIVVGRSLWHLWSRPIGSLTVGDAVLSGMVLRWWLHRRQRLHGAPPPAGGAWSGAGSRTGADAWPPSSRGPWHRP